MFATETIRENQLVSVAQEVIPPYVVSADIRLLLTPWAIRQGFILPSISFFTDLRADFSAFMSSIFCRFEFLSEEELLDGFLRMTGEHAGLPIIALDKTYYLGKFQLEITREADEEGNSLGLVHRAGTPSLITQFRMIKSRVSGEVALADDVIFEGELTGRLIPFLRRHGIYVKVVYAAVGIQKGIDAIANLVDSVECVRVYENVIDEICERDFYPGVPLSGRLLAKSDNVGVPYLSPFAPTGKTEKWASIPTKNVPSFSRFCIRQAINLFSEIEKCSNRPVLCSDLPRKVHHQSFRGDRYFVEMLKDLL